MSRRAKFERRWLLGNPQARGQEKRTKTNTAKLLKYQFVVFISNKLVFDENCGALKMARRKWTELEKVSLSSPVLEALASFGFEKTTPVQSATIPLLLERKDVSVEAVTGSGKTLAFLVPMLEMLQRRHTDMPWNPKEIGGLIISPTRELAYQISEVLAKFLEQEDLQYLRQKLLVGGSNLEEDISALKKESPNILVCTPGRLDDIFERKGDLNLASRVKSLEFLVLDEADRLLDLGFKATINNILGYLPRQRRTGLFSATQTTEVTALIRAGLRNPVRVSVKEKSSISTPAKLQNFYKIVEPEEKFLAVLNFLRSPLSAHGKVMVFFPTCACVEYWTTVIPQFLPERCILGIHGKMKNKRKNIVERFRQVTDAVLLCTDVLARGLDVPEIDWVVQWDPPASASSFVHRVGRTARQGNEGNALIYLLPSEDAYITFLKINQKVDLSELLGSDHNRDDLKKILQTLHNLQLKDKDIFDKGTRALVSHIQAYTKHECNAILRLKDLDLGKVATAYGLLQMPRMPELKNCEAINFIGPTFEIDITKLSYKNPQKEQQRQEKLKVYEECGVWPRKKKFNKRTESWEQTKKAKMDTKTKKDLRKAKKQRKNDSGAQNDATSARGKKRKPQYTKQDLEELANDIRLFKKLKRNKITEEDFDKEMGIED
ncbi:probable ATP-dependent RNA helicase DDX55 homolog [Rhagoletis pomonella]|uniref:probable ATP-dependent RNA helicase DDX55 homolog n=1 Tax=Rhagoletis pomonella TaxID=28610 RepID=UPI00177BDD44|nr:probable ATP-dependent RNA helicase DDX55 homolog [Rhagoletis pomonella]